MSRLFTAATALAIAILCSGSVGAVRAATVTRGEQACNIRLDGSIKQGDNAQVADELAKIQAGAHVVLCLNSPGGSYNAALAVIETLLGADRIVATMVPRGANCYSACALIFLAGHSSPRKDEPDRRMDASSTLAFHGPYIKPGEKEYDPVLVARAYREGMKAIGKLIGLSHEKLFPESLLSIGMEKGPEEFFFIDTIDKAGKWNITVTGTKVLRLANQKSIFRACANNSIWIGSIAAHDNSRAIGIPFSNRKYRAALPDFGDEALWTCVADVYDGGDKGHFLDIHFVTELDSPDLPGPDELERKVRAAGNAVPAPGVPVWYSLDKATKLKQLAGGTN